MMAIRTLTRKKRRTSPLPQLERLEARALLSAVIAITGNGNSIVIGDSTPDVSDFTDFREMLTVPNSSMGTSHRVFVITNTGDQTLNLTDSNLVTISGDTADFSVSGFPTSPLAPNATTSFDITFTPQASGHREAVITILSNDPDQSEFNFTIQGTGLTGTDLGGGLNIATTTAGTGTGAISGSPLAVDYTATLLDGTFIGSNSSPFLLTLGSNSVIDGWEQGLLGIKSGETRTLFIPAPLANHLNPPINGALSVDTPIVFTVSALSVGPPTIGVKGHNVTIVSGDTTPSSTDFTNFGNMAFPVGTYGTLTRTYQISAVTGDVVITGPITVTGTNAADFVVTTNPATTIHQGTSSGFTVTFTPHGLGTRTATITIPSNDPNTPSFSFDVQGSGITTNNATNGLMTFTSATGSGLTAITGSKVGITFTGSLFDGTLFDSETSSSSPFNVVIGHADIVKGLSQGLLGIQPGESRTLIFPASLGFGTITNGPIPANSPLFYNVTAVSVADPTFDSNVIGNGHVITVGDTTPSFTDFTDFGYMSTTPNASIGTVTRTYAITNDGGFDLTLTGVPNLVAISGANAADFIVTQQPASSTITAGSAGTFTITFVPHGTGLRTATVTVTTNDVDHPFFSFNIQGTGVTTTINSTAGLMISTLTAGSGVAAFSGASLTVNYTGFLTTGTIFDSSDPAINPGRTPFDFVLGIGDVIQGWDKGLVGLKPGETRILIIPGSQAYPGGNGNIPAGAPLIFKVTGVAIHTPTIAVQGNGILIPKGDTTPSVNDFTDYRFMSANPENSTTNTIGTIHHTFFVGNTGSGALQFSGIAPVSISGANSADFHVTLQPNNTSGGFTIDFTPHAAGLRKAVVTVHTNDPLTPAFNFTIQGTGIITANNTVNHLEYAITKTGTTVLDTQSTLAVEYFGWSPDGTTRYSGGELILQKTNTTSDLLTGVILANGSPDTIHLTAIKDAIRGMKEGEVRFIAVPQEVGFVADNTSSTLIPGDATLFLTITAKPRELIVFANNTIIPAGATAGSSANLTLLGPTTQSQLSQTYGITAFGNTTILTLTSPFVSITGSGASAFKSTSIDFNTFSFTVTFKPSKPGTYSAIAHVRSNDPANPDYKFTITATQSPWTDLTGSIGNINFPGSGTLISGNGVSYNVPLNITHTGAGNLSSTTSGVNFLVYLHKTTDSGTANDVLLSTTISTALRNLAPGGTKTINLPAPIPVTVTPGIYQIVTKFNSNGAITELNSSNNTVSSTHLINITQGFNDLVVSPIIAPISLPATSLSGAPTLYKLPLSITNSGNVPIASSPITFNIYAHNATGGTDLLVSSFTSTALKGLAVGATAKPTLTTTLPITLPAGSYSFVVKVNENAALPETPLGNNNATSSQFFTVTQGFNDLAATLGAISLPATSLITGNSTLFKLPLTVTNNGNIPVAANSAVTLKIYAHNATANTDTLIFTTTTSALRNLAVGASAKITLSTALPIAIPTGTFQFRVSVNEDTSLPEANLTNNTPLSSQTFSTTQGVYNLAGNLSTSTFATSIVHGTALTGKINVTVRNAGNLTLPANQKITLQIVALLNGNPSNPVLIGTASTFSVSSFIANKSSTFSLTKSLLAGLTAGSYTLAVQLAPTPSLTQSTADDLINQTPTLGTFNLTVT